MKIILVLLDGLGDRSYEVLDFQTPLEAAEIPNMDKMISRIINPFFHLKQNVFLHLLPHWS